MSADAPIAYSLTPAGALLSDLARQVAAHVPLTADVLGAGEEVALAGQTLPGMDLDARGVVVRRAGHAMSRQLGRGAFLEVHTSGLSAREREILERAEDLGAECS